MLQYRASWIARITGVAGTLEEFWDAISSSGSPLFADHPVRHKDLRRAVPISLHADGVPTVAVGKAWGKSLDVFSWNSLVGAGGTKDTNFLVWAVFQSVINVSLLRAQDKGRVVCYGCCLATKNPARSTPHSLTATFLL